MGLEQKKILVTGATGFLGKNLVPSLIDRGATVIAAVRNRHGKATAKKLGAAGKTVQLNNVTALTRLMRDVDAVVHLAYDVRASPAKNLEWFECVHEAAKTANVAHFVHLSSAVVYENWPTKPTNEDGTLVTPNSESYRGAKAAMEQIALSDGPPVTILQPTIVWGSGSAQWTGKFARILASQDISLPVESGLCNAVHVADVTQSIVLALTLGPSATGRFLVSGNGEIEWRDLLEGYAGIIGGGKVLRVDGADLRAKLGPRPANPTGATQISIAARISAAARVLIGNENFEKLLKAVRRGSGSSHSFQADHTLLDLWQATGRVDIAKARTVLGYGPEFDLKAGLAECRQYLRSEATAKNS